ncbi:LOW QUALITY PROTEIN: LIM and calponin homology domains-containing protein 1 [Pelodytes ibericus]
MASPVLAPGEIPQPQESPPDAACREAQKWIEQVTGRSFGDKDFRSGLENGILLCELLNAIKPGLVKKINRLPTPIAGLDNITLFLRGCKELGLKESQLFDPGDLQDTSNRTTIRIADCNRKLRNVLVTVYWLGKVASGCTSYSGNHLDLKEFEGLLAQMRKENEEIENPKRSVRDSGYIDCWDSERSDSLSPPRHCRDDSFDSLDSFGSRSQQTPSPDVVLRGSSDGRGSDSESDLPHRRLPDVRKDDMSARRVSFGENKAFVPFNQYLPNKNNQTSYIPAPLRKKKAEREDYRKSWSTATSPLGGERPFSQTHPETIEEEPNDLQSKNNRASSLKQPPERTGQVHVPFGQQEEEAEEKVGARITVEELERLKSLEQAGIKVISATKRYSSQKPVLEDHEPDIVLRKESTSLMCSEREDMESEEEGDCRIPDIERDDLATRRTRMNQPRTTTPFNPYIHGSYLNKKKPSQETSKTSAAAPPLVKSMDKSLITPQKTEKLIITRKENTFPNPASDESDEEEKQEKIPDIHRDDLAKRKTQGFTAQQKEPLVFAAAATITKADLETWQRLKVSSEDSDLVTKQSSEDNQTCKIDVTRATNDDFGRRKLSLQQKRARNKQKFVHFGPVTEIDQQKWDRLCIAKANAGQESGADVKDGSSSDMSHMEMAMLATVQISPSPDTFFTRAAIQTLPSPEAGLVELCRTPDLSEPPERDDAGQFLDTQRDDMLARRTGAFQKLNRLNQLSPVSHDQHAIESRPGEKYPNEELPEGNPAKHPDEIQQLAYSANRNRKTDCCSPKENTQTNEKTPALVREIEQDGDCPPERETNTPVLEKDDMMARRVLLSQKQTSVGLSHFLPIPFSVQKREEKSLPFSKKEQKPVSSTPSDTIIPKMTAERPTAIRFDRPSEPNHLDGHNELKDERTHHQYCDPIQSHSVVNPFCAELSSLLQGADDNYDFKISRFSPRSALSDDAESMSMCDMRYEEESCMLPHSRAHHEHLQNVNDLLKEEDDTWQDDLAKWKTRRRSASQDLIKKDQERKKVERLLSGDSDSSGRRKSIKTYKEIVEEKERRERELHEAYKNAKSKEEAEKILQKYIERFTISEAVLERLVMPKILERSHSAEPSLLTSSGDPNPLRYLRQQSLPSPKYTATVEATISPSSENDFKVPAGRVSPSKSVISKAVPMLTAKPYSQPKNTQQVLKTFKVDGKVSVNGDAFNGETFNGMEGQKDIGCGMVFASSLTRSQRFEGKARVDAPVPEKLQDVSSIELSLTRPNIQDSVKELQGFTGTANHVGLRDEADSTVIPESVQSVQKFSEGNMEPVGMTQGGSSVSSLEFTPCIPLKESAVNGKDSEEERKVDAKALIMNWSLDSNLKSQTERAFSPSMETNEEQRHESSKSVQLNITLKIRNTCRCSQYFYPSGVAECNKDSPALTPSLNSPSRFCSWDPDEERKRQERWQQEQERMLQERYQKEQEKLKEEWEKAQKEVEEEERKYYEEERKIIEDTVGPLTVSPVASVHVAVSERNGSLAITKNDQGDQEQKAGKLWTESQRSLTDSTLTAEHNRPQTLLWEQEGALHRAEEEQIKGLNNRLEMVEPVIMVEHESEQRNHVRECNTPPKCNLQPRVQQVTPPKNHVPVDLGSPNDVVAGNMSPVITRGTDVQENMRGVCYPSQSCTSQCQSPNRYKRSVSGKKLCSTCGLPLGKGAAMIIETLSLYFHIQCFKCGVCRGQLGDATTGTDVRIRNGLLNCNDCYVRSRTAGHPTPL